MYGAIHPHKLATITQQIDAIVDVDVDKKKQKLARTNLAFYLDSQFSM